DGVVDAVDVAPFVLALTNPGEYQNQHGIDPVLVGDINNDGALDAVDVQPFVQLLVGGGGAVAIPEPGSLALLGLGGLALLRRKRVA
ncbi:MAG: PEP-CTERM sorting domain-containing protein, partial [Phycisphaeraceae bacterium]